MINPKPKAMSFSRRRNIRLHAVALEIATRSKPIPFGGLKVAAIENNLPISSLCGAISRAKKEIQQYLSA